MIRGTRDVQAIVDDEAERIGIDIDAVRRTEETQYGEVYRILEHDAADETDQVGFQVTVPDSIEEEDRVIRQIKSGLSALAGRDEEDTPDTEMPADTTPTTEDTDDQPDSSEPRPTVSDPVVAVSVDVTDEISAEIATLRGQMDYEEDLDAAMDRLDELEARLDRIESVFGQVVDN